jgi:signal peptidase I
MAKQHSSKKDEQRIEHKDGSAARKKPSTWYGKLWQFLWYEDSVASWAVSIALAFVLIKFVIYPGLGLVFGTQFPIVAVVSNSMEHDEGFDTWWAENEDRYLRFNITKEEFSEYPMRGGFDKGDIIILVGTAPEEIERGDVIVYWGGKQYPIIHRTIAIDMDEDGRFFQTKGDHNPYQIVPDQGRCGELSQTYGIACLRNAPPYMGDCCLNEAHVSEEVFLGRAVLRVPYLGWVKIGFVKLLNLVGIPAA